MCDLNIIHQFGTSIKEIYKISWSELKVPNLMTILLSFS